MNLHNPDHSPRRTTQRQLPSRVSLAGKRVSPHVLRHTCAMNLLHAGVDIATIALWLGHADIRSTQTYLHADLALKERALSRTTPPNTAPGRYRPSDTLLAFLLRFRSFAGDLDVVPA